MNQRPWITGLAAHFVKNGLKQMGFETLS